jgi:di/tricarboxylate transporter
MGCQYLYLAGLLQGLMIPPHLQPYLVLLVIVAAFVVIYRQSLRPPITLLLANLVFIITGVLSTKELLAGLANEPIISILLLILLTAGIRKNFQLEASFDILYRNITNYRSFLLLMMSKVALVSSFMNNTPVVAAMTPYVFNWGRRNKITPSKLLIPLSYATICGGMITLIGTSTTLVLNGFLIEQELGSLDLGKLLIIGLVVTAVVILFIALVGHRLLPDRSHLLDEFNRNKREYLLETKVQPDSPLAGKTVEAAGLRHLSGVFLAEVIRDEQTITPVGPTQELEANDTLIFAGNTNDIMDLVTQDRGLALPEPGSALQRERLKLVEVVVSNNSNLIGKKVKETDFRSRYNAAIVAIHRNGSTLRGKIGDIKIHQGDLLLLFAGKRFQQNLDVFRDLFLISKFTPAKRPGKTKKWSLLLITLLVFILLLIGHFSLFSSLLILTALMASLKDPQKGG